ncbi:HEPN domain-containing protein, partial [Candidatus Pyrohabitans sp.]
MISFHCQQAVEKYLKAYLTSVDARVKKTHDLEVILNQCIPHKGVMALFGEHFIKTGIFGKEFSHIRCSCYFRKLASTTSKPSTVKPICIILCWVSKRL